MCSIPSLVLPLFNVIFCVINFYCRRFVLSNWTWTGLGDISISISVLSLPMSSPSLHSNWTVMSHCRSHISPSVFLFLLEHGRIVAIPLLSGFASFSFVVGNIPD